MERWRDDSWGVLDWVDVADRIFDLGGFVLEVAFHLLEGALEVAVALLGLLDGI